MILVSQKDRTWTDSNIPGVQTCRTWISEDGIESYLAKFQAGTSFPKHTHIGWEQIIVLEGVIRFNDVEMQAGDVLQVQGTDEHKAFAVENTLLFITHHGGIELTE
ncbi:cupin domain-containing protein [Acinetobacter pittii]|uniref:ChrR Cupin-like domain protein n=1 Tax=Acinetobacter pittii TaxID=48296 RepID=A0AB33BGW7_ACIPI|nr:MULTISPECIES: cupin domain-containing protein [Acinetobacter]AMX18676.1 ChrR Cupin-like domain protein [Acinetobacter pittii]AZB91033.1 cupin domain-containing protein [Acinetobacter pittii]MBJ6351157.1 cupin domain-containing protein [Acinetobacter sp. c1]MBJ9578999.1 cupin domain-containing protein [Acinetobacter baumannii]MBM0956783.1 cupin domain-containing protein [Acinetobacter sp. C13]